VIDGYKHTKATTQTTFLTFIITRFGIIH